MKVLVLGGGGLIGHQLFRELTDAGIDTYATLHGAKTEYSHWPFLQTCKVIENIDLMRPGQIQVILDQTKPQWILNAVGITIRKQQPDDPRASIYLNSFMPHEIDYWCRKNSAKLIHYSTDCVFSGSTGSYSEDSRKDAYDLYGQTKALGEVAMSPNTLTLRSSFLGRELKGKTELLEWFLSQTGQNVKGFDRAYYSGVTTYVLAELTLRILREKPHLTGLFQIASQPVSKFELLQLFKAAFGKKIEIIADSKVVVNKTLLADKWLEVTGWALPTWPEMIGEIARDSKFYGNSYSGSGL